MSLGSFGCVFAEGDFDRWHGDPELIDEFAVAIFGTGVGFFIAFGDGSDHCSAGPQHVQQGLVEAVRFNSVRGSGFGGADVFGVCFVRGVVGRVLYL